MTAWEPWNEPSTSGWGTGAGYVTSVLAPFYKGVKAADAASQGDRRVDLEVPLSWWQALIAAHGLSYLDVAAVHPYPGNNDSLEEDGILSQVDQLQHLLGHVPLWFTEVGWWGDGDYNVVNQANDIAQAVLLQRTLGIPVWNYYYSEGAGGTGTVSLSLIQTVSGDDYVKAGALATMVVAHQTADRPYLGTGRHRDPLHPCRRFRAVGIRRSHPSSGGVVRRPGDDRRATRVSPHGRHGARHPRRRVRRFHPGHLAERGGLRPADQRAQIAYVVYPGGDRASIEATEAYGANLALASTGAQASASSGDATAVITGLDTGTGWSSAAGQADPTLTVTLPRPASVDRVVVDTQSPGSTATGLRNYTVAIHGHGQPERPPLGSPSARSSVSTATIRSRSRSPPERSAPCGSPSAPSTTAATPTVGSPTSGPSLWPGWPSSTPCRSTPAPTGPPPSPAPP